MATIEVEKDSTSNIARRYTHLFRLPSAAQAILYASIPTVAIEFLTRTILGAGLERIALYALATEILLIFAIEIDYLVLRRSSAIATFRRVSAVSILSNAVWFIVALVAFAVFFFTKSEGRFFSLILVGAFFAVAFRALIFGSAFYRSPLRGLPLAFVQPVILILPAALSLKAVSLYSANTIAALVGGVAAVIGIETYLYVINKPRISEEFRAFTLLQAFLSAWTFDNPAELERLFELASKEREVESTIIKIRCRDKTPTNPAAELIVPGIHPGPFYPVGSSNLPGDLYKGLRTSDSIPLVVHSISDHELNLPSGSEVEHYVTSLNAAQEIDHGNELSSSVVKRCNKATVSGFALGRTLVIAATQAPFGMEDLPVQITREINAEARKKGFVSAFVIDSHNSLGTKPNKEETLDIIRAAKDVVAELSSAKQHSFYEGFAHSSEIDAKLPEDIGPAGVGLVLLVPENIPGFCLVIVDANNAQQGFREKVIGQFAAQCKGSILEICTSDTHVTAARTVERKGYLALGDRITPEEFSMILTSLHEKARSRLSPAEFTAFFASSKVRTVGGEVLDDFSGLLDQTSLIAKRGAAALAAVAVIVTVLVAIV